LQEEIAKEISEKLRLKLTGEDEKRLTKRYTENAEAYELYLKGRYHLNKLTPPEVQTSVSYFQQAIAIDPSYALAYVGLADANRALALSVDLPATEFFPKSKAAAQKAIEIDDTLAEAHAVLGFAIFFYDWDWSAAENQYKRALELNPNSSDAHLYNASLVSLMGRRAEGLAEVKRARELDPLNLRANALEGQFLILAGQTDDGLARLQKTFELEPNFWLAHLFAASAYIQKGMYREAIAEATRARDLSGGNAEAIATIGYALAMSGKRDEARAVLDELKKRTTERYVPPYDFALVYNGLGERDEAFAWLERGVEQRDPKMIFLKVEPKWNNLRDDPRFVSLLERILGERS
jgi:Tfp pilus assembly protein PilF